jgi:transcriptional regulator with XRE-family HTH domain
MSSQEKIGINIKKARLKAKLTQKQLAKKANIHANYFARVERGEVNPSIDILESIAKALKVKSSTILPF